MVNKVHINVSVLYKVYHNRMLQIENAIFLRCVGFVNSFVEDRLATLRNVIKDPALDQWNLYLGTPPVIFELIL